MGEAKSQPLALQSYRMWRLVESKRGSLTAAQWAKISIFKARFDFAHDLRSLQLNSLSNSTGEAYFVLLKLGLAYSAIDALRRVLPKERAVCVYESNVEAAIRSGELKEYIDFLHREARSEDERKNLNQFRNGKSKKDLYKLVEHSRHVMFHGVLTPNAVKLAQGKKRRELILGLANAALAASEKSLLDWLRTLPVSELAKDH